MEEKLKKIAFLSLFLSATLSAQFFDNNCCCNRAFGVGAEWLHWKPVQEDLEFASLVSGNFDEATTTTTVNATLLRPKFKYSNGFRVFAEYTTCDQEWTFATIYTHLQSNARQRAAVDPATIRNRFISVNSTTFPILAALTENQIVFSSMDARWRLKFAYLDFDICKNFSLFRDFEINPHFGLRSLWTKQNFNLSGDPVTADPMSATSRFREKFDSIGIEGGLSANFQVACGFSIIGNIGGSILYGRIKTRESLEVLDGGGLTVHTMTQDVKHPRTTFETFVGLQYANQLCGFPIEAHAGWEQHVLFHVNHFPLLRYADLTLQGLTLGGSVHF